jgi:hypothetical protein
MSKTWGYADYHSKRKPNYEIVYFQIKPYEIHPLSVVITGDTSLPIVFDNNKIIGWGDNFCSQFDKENDVFGIWRVKKAYDDIIKSKDSSSPPPR